jgi:hypothetical protein
MDIKKLFSIRIIHIHIIRIQIGSDVQIIHTTFMFAICVELTIGSKTLPTTFFVIKGRGSYNLLLGWDWIHANCCIPSTMHQCIIQWITDSVEMVKGETSLIVAATEAQGWT